MAHNSGVRSWGKSINFPIWAKNSHFLISLQLLANSASFHSPPLPLHPLITLLLSIMETRTQLDLDQVHLLIPYLLIQINQWADTLSRLLSWSKMRFLRFILSLLHLPQLTLFTQSVSHSLTDYYGSYLTIIPLGTGTPTWSERRSDPRDLTF